MIRVRMAGVVHVELEEGGRGGALEGLEVEILAGDDAALAKTPLDGLVGKVGVVVLGAEVA